MRAEFACDSTTEVVPVIVLAGGKEFAVRWEAIAQARAPPDEECVATRPRNRRGRVHLAAAMQIIGTEYEISTPIFGHWNIDDGTGHHRIHITRRARSLRQTECGIAQRQVVELKIRPESEIFAV